MGREPGRQPVTQRLDSLVHQPFRVLNGLVVHAPREPRTHVPAVTDNEQGEAGDARDPAEMFLQAVADVRPLAARARDRVARPGPAAGPRPVSHPDAEALAELCDLVAGTAPFDIADGDEYVEGAAVGVDRRLLRRLRTGEFAYQAHVDLHGLTAEEARCAVDAFLFRAHLNRHRCVLIVHGRGRNSKDQIPVLKTRLVSWLARGQSTRMILAFTSARPCDGGAGAMYVLLRRNRDLRRPIRVTEGARS